MARFSAKLTPEAQAAFGAFDMNKAMDVSQHFEDWKQPEARMELFNRYYKWRVMAHDLDHTHYMKTLCKDYTWEQKAWFAFCFGMTYRTPQAFAYTETFNSIYDVTEEWHVANWKRTTYGTDARYNKGHFFTQVTSILAWLGGKSFEEKIKSIVVHPTQRENFWALYSEVLSLYKFGRMTGWLTMQALYDLLELPIDPEDIMLDGFSPNNDSSLQSIWNGLCAYTSQPNKMVGKYGSYTCTPDDVAWAKGALLEFTEAAERTGGFKIDSFRRESVWCQYKRLFGEDGSKEYPGHASGDATSRYLYYREHWPEIDWSSFRAALRMQPGIVKGQNFVDWQNAAFGNTGCMMNLHELYDDMPNVWEYMEIDPCKYKIKEIWLDDGLEVPTTIDSKADFLTTPKWYGTW